jgi:hypothetical protein
LPIGRIVSIFQIQIGLGLENYRSSFWVEKLKCSDHEPQPKTAAPKQKLYHVVSISEILHGKPGTDADNNLLLQNEPNSTDTGLNSLRLEFPQVRRSVFCRIGRIGHGYSQPSQLNHSPDGHYKPVLMLSRTAKLT